MAMAMMHVGDVRVFVPRGLMAVQVRVRLSRRVARFMSVLVVLIVCMRMRMLVQLMFVFMFVMFGQVQPDAEPHQ